MLRRQKSCASGTTTSPERFEEFAARYREELKGSAALDDLRKLTKPGVVTLVTATRHVEGSQAAVLATLLRRR